MDDIDSVNRELESIRQVLRNEGERVRQEIAGYVRLSQASMAAMTLISLRASGSGRTGDLNCPANLFGVPRPESAATLHA